MSPDDTKGHEQVELVTAVLLSENPQLAIDEALRIGQRIIDVLKRMKHLTADAPPLDSLTPNAETLAAIAEADAYLKATGQTIVPGPDAPPRVEPSEEKE